MILIHNVLIKPNGTEQESKAQPRAIVPDSWSGSTQDACCKGSYFAPGEVGQVVPWVLVSALLRPVDLLDLDRTVFQVAPE